MGNPTDTRGDFSWLAGTYWYVPAADMPALQYDPDRNSLAWMVDQTVWHITGYRSGYFWGTCAVATSEAGPGSGKPRPRGLALLGSITPEGRVHMTFVPSSALTSRSATVGVGQAVQVEGGTSLEMQMSSGSRDTTLHWAYMLQTRPGEPSFEELPGVGISVREMLDGIDPPEPPKG